MQAELATWLLGLLLLLGWPASASAGDGPQAEVMQLRVERAEGRIPSFMNLVNGVPVDPRTGRAPFVFLEYVRRLVYYTPQPEEIEALASAHQSGLLGLFIAAGVLTLTSAFWDPGGSLAVLPLLATWKRRRGLPRGFRIVEMSLDDSSRPTPNTVRATLAAA